MGEMNLEGGRALSSARRLSLALRAICRRLMRGGDRSFFGAQEFRQVLFLCHMLIQDGSQNVPPRPPRLRVPVALCESGLSRLFSAQRGLGHIRSCAYAGAGRFDWLPEGGVCHTSPGTGRLRLRLRRTESRERQFDPTLFGWNDRRRFGGGTLDQIG